METQREHSSKLKLVFVGAGWVGGLTSAVLADHWPEHDFYVFDVSKRQIDKWNSLEPPFYEQGLPEIIRKVCGKNLFFTDNRDLAFEDGDFYLICVHTPSKSAGLGRGEAHDLRFVEACSRDIADYWSKRQMVKPIAIVEKSTVGPRTCDMISELFLESQVDFPSNRSKVCVLSNPEFLAEGVAVRDLKQPDRVIIGGGPDRLSQDMLETLSSLYARFIPRDKIILTNTYESELSKLVANAFLAQRVSSINSLTPICERLGLDVRVISKCIGSDSRIGSKYLTASVGFGGSCLEKDVLALVYLARSLGLREVADYWQQVVTFNDHQKRRLSQMIIEDHYNAINGKKIAILGVAFKKDTNDCRASPALSVVSHLLEEGASLQVFDPQTPRAHFTQEYSNYHPNKQVCEADLERVTFFESVADAAAGSNCIVVLTEWDQFKSLDWRAIHKLVKRPARLYDFRAVIDGQAAREAGFKVFVVGSSRTN